MPRGRGNNNRMCKMKESHTRKVIHGPARFAKGKSFTIFTFLRGEHTTLIRKVMRDDFGIVKRTEQYLGNAVVDFIIVSMRGG